MATGLFASLCLEKHEEKMYGCFSRRQWAPNLYFTGLKNSELF